MVFAGVNSCGDGVGSSFTCVISRFVVVVDGTSDVICCVVAGAITYVLSRIVVGVVSGSVLIGGAFDVFTVAKVVAKW